MFKTHILITAGLGSIIGLLLFIASFKTINQSTDSETLSTYECGFENLSSSREQFELRYLIVGSLFIIMDIEIVLLFPIVAIIKMLTISQFLIIFLFILLLGLGLLFEWSIGALEW